MISKKGKFIFIFTLFIIIIVIIDAYIFGADKSPVDNPLVYGEDGKKELLENIKATSSIQNVINFNNSNFNLYEEENINNGIAYYYSEGGYENSQKEIIINIYDADIKADELAEDVLASRNENGDKIYLPFNSLDSKNNNAYYITSLANYYPNEPYADIYIMKIFETDRTNMIIYRESLAGAGKFGLELIADTWLEENLEEYSKAIDMIEI